jgi:hypothetical protein
VWVSWAGLALACLPPQGRGVSLCWIHAGSGVPCPGCGIARSLGHAARGYWEQSWQCHPFGIPILGFFAAVAAASLLPAATQGRLTSALRSRPGTVRAAKLGFLAAFVGFGLVRAALQVAGIGDFGI